MGRGPKATISFTYCIARAELKAGGGPRSGEVEKAPGATGEVVETWESFGEAATSFSRAQANNVSGRVKQKATAMNSQEFPSRFCRWVDVILLFVLPSPCAVLDAPATQSRCSRGKARPWVRQRCTYSECRWWA